MGKLKQGEEVTVISARPDTEDTTAIQIIIKNNNGDTEDIYVAKDDEWVSEIGNN